MEKLTFDISGGGGGGSLNDERPRFARMAHFPVSINSWFMIQIRGVLLISRILEKLTIDISGGVGGGGGGGALNVGRPRFARMAHFPVAINSWSSVWGPGCRVSVVLGVLRADGSLLISLSKFF